MSKKKIPETTVKKLKPFDQPGTLMQRVLKLLDEDERTPLDLYYAHGIPFYWTKSIIEGSVDNPSVNRMEALYNILAKQPLTLP